MADDITAFPITTKKLSEMATDGTINSGDLFLVKSSDGVTRVMDADTLFGYFTEEAPVDNDYYVRRNGVWTPVGLQQKLNGFDRDDTNTLGVIQYCHDAVSGIVYNIDEDGVLTTLTSQLYFADGVTALTNRTFAHYHSLGQSDFSFYHQGTLFTIDNLKTIQLADDSDRHVICYDSNGDLVEVSDPENAIKYETIVTVIVNNATAGYNVWFGDERHGIVMSPDTHYYQHTAHGTAHQQGLRLQIPGTPTTDYTSVDSGVILDEDIKHTLASATSIPWMYRLGATGEWTFDGSDTAFVFDNGTGTTWYYNEWTGSTWQLTSIGASNQYSYVQLLATGNKRYPLIKVIGQKIWASPVTASNEVCDYADEFLRGSLPGPEIKCIALWLVDGGGELEPGPDGEYWLDTRGTSPIKKFS